MSLRDRKESRVAILKAAAARCGCTIMEIYTRAEKGLRKVVMNLEKIPERIIRYARRVLRQRVVRRVAKKPSQSFFRASPSLSAH